MAENDAQQAEELQAWLKEYGKYIIAGLIVGIGAVVGWQQWQAKQTGQAQDSARAYQNFVSATQADNKDLSNSTFASLTSEHATSPYPAHAALLQARQAMDNGDNDLAVTKLQWAIEHAQSNEIKLLARLRLAKMQLAANKLDDATTTATITEAGAFAPLYAELLGDIAFAKGDKSAALASYQEALSSWGNNLGRPAHLQMKIDNLAQPDTGENS